jgi:membrane protein
MLSALRRAIGGARDAIQTHARDVWKRDRASLRGAKALANRILRIAIISLRGIWAHRLGLQSAALTYYTVFSLVPLLVVALWILKAFGRLSIESPEMPVATEVTKGNAALHFVLGRLVENLNHTSQVTTGVVGLVALLYTVVRLFMRTERALDLIALSTTRKPQFFRLFGYLGLLLLPPLLGLVAGAIAGVSHSAIGSKISGLFGSAPRLKLAVAAAVGLTGIWLTISIFYSAAARARIAFSSSAVGAAAATFLLFVVLWVFAEFQIGMSRGNSVQFGTTAGPVFLLWTFSSWYVVLFGAEIAVGHGVDRVLVHGAWCFRLDAVGEQETGLEIMLRATRANVTVDGLARELRLAPQLVREIGARLVDCGLLAEDGRDRFALARTPDRINVAEVIDAVVRDPALESIRRGRVDQHLLASLIASRQRAGPDQTLFELAHQSERLPPSAAEVTSSVR